MDWRQIQANLLEAARRLKSQKFLDASISALFASIPVVGNFAGEYWKALDDSDEHKADQLAQILETAARQENQLAMLERLLVEQSQGLQTLIRHLRADAVGKVITFNMTMERERERSRDLIDQAVSILKGEQTDEEDFYRLGQMYLSAHRPDEAKACFLAALERKSDFAKAYLGMAHVYQIQGNTMIRQQYFQAAEDALAEAQRYADEAAKGNTADAAVHNQLGYSYSTLAQSYLSRKQQALAERFYEQARKHFHIALALDDRDASAQNGLGGIALALGDYDEAIERSRQATALNPRYLFAFHDLTLGYYQKLGTMPVDTKERLEILAIMIESYIQTVELDGQVGAGTLPPAARDALDSYAAWAQTEVDRVTKRPKAGPGPSDDKVIAGLGAPAKQTDTMQPESNSASLLQFSGHSIPGGKRSQFTQLVRAFLDYMRAHGARFGAEPAVKVVAETQFGQSVHYDPLANELVVSLAMIDEDDFILRECCFRIFHEPLAALDVKREVGELTTTGRGFEVGSLIAGLGFYFVCSFHDTSHFSCQGQELLDLERPDRSVWAEALSIGRSSGMRVEDRLAFITAVGDRWAHVLWGLRKLAGRDPIDKMILDSWNELNIQEAFQLGHTGFHAALLRRLTAIDGSAALAMERLAKELLKT
jgi:tetratricopeptide (TPR) repeat protein